MSNVELSPKNKKLNKWSWAIAMTVTIVVFSISALLTLNVQLSAIVGAGVGIGIQFFTPYYTALSVPAEKRSELDSSPDNETVHQGAAGASVAAGSLTLLVAELIQIDPNVGLLFGGIIFVGSYFLFRDALP